jgi:hypothetical protein
VLQPDGQVDDEGGLDEPSPADPARGFKRLATAILLTATIDLLESSNRQVQANAAAFLFPRSPEAKQHFRATVECSGLGQVWLQEKLSRVRDSAATFSHAQIRRARYR